MNDPLDHYEPQSSLLDNPQPFCEEGSGLALEFMLQAGEAVKQAGTTESGTIRLAVNEALERLLEHRESCPRCNED